MQIVILWIQFIFETELIIIFYENHTKQVPFIIVSNMFNLFDIKIIK